MIRTVFLGSPATALRSLQALVDHPRTEVVGVITQPDKPAGRRRRPQPCAVRAGAEALGLRTFTPARIGAAEAVAVLREWGVALAIVCAYGQLLPETVLSLPRLGCYNLHFSLLPRWRGASPVQAALLAGDAVTGVSLQRMVLALDAGDIVTESAPLLIAPQHTAQTLAALLAEEAGALLARSLPLLLAGDPPAVPQDAAAVTHCRQMRKEHGAVDFAAEDAATIERKCRAYTPWPGCYAFLEGRRLGLVRMTLAAADTAEAAADGTAAERPVPPGVVQADGRVRTREGWLRIEEVRPEGKGAMPFAAFRNGRPTVVGALLRPRPD